MRHDAAWQRLPDLLDEGGGPGELRRHVARCHDCQRQLFLLQRVDRLLRSRPPSATKRRRVARTGRRFALLVAGAVAATLLFTLSEPRAPTVRELTFRSSAGVGVVVRGSLEPRDAANAVLTIVGRGLPHEDGNANFLVWGRAVPRSEPVVVGRFMADPRGECRARFTISGERRWVRFWVTPVSSPSSIVAVTAL
jgi:hypothetical protein